MFLWNLLRHFFQKRKVDNSEFHSIVLLLREFHFFTADELREAGRIGWGKRFDGEEDSLFFVVQNGPVTLIKAGIHAIQVLNQNQPYLGDPDETAKTLLLKRQQDAWRAHQAWASIDLWHTSEIPKTADAYAALSKFALNLLDSNCNAVYLPKHNVLLTNDGQAEEWLLGFIHGKKML